MEKHIFRGSAIDLGTNSCRMLIGREVLNSQGTYDLQIERSFLSYIRLGEGLAHNKALSSEAMDRALSALYQCNRIMKKYGIVSYRAVATQACREALNGKELCHRVRRETGLNLEIIPAQEESRLMLLGCENLIKPESSHILVFDIGGGSTEVTLGIQKSPFSVVQKAYISLPCGILTMYENCKMSTFSHQQLEALFYKLSPFLETLGRHTDLMNVLQNKKLQVIAASNTSSIIAAIDLDLKYYRRSKVDGYFMHTQRALYLLRRLAAMPIEERQKLAVIGEKRAKLLGVGCALLYALLNKWKVDGFYVADRGIREGILRAMMKNSHSLFSEEKTYGKL